MCSTRLDYSKFQQIWARSEPLVVTGVQHTMQGKWTPAYFTQRYGSDVVTITDCESDNEYTSTVAQFFSGFGAEKTQTNNRVLKLKAGAPLVSVFPTADSILHRIGPRRATSGMSFLSCMRVLSTAYHFRIIPVLTESTTSQLTSPLMALFLILVSACELHRYALKSV